MLVQSYIQRKITNADSNQFGYFITENSSFIIKLIITVFIRNIYLLNIILLWTISINNKIKRRGSDSTPHFKTGRYSLLCVKPNLSILFI